MKIILISLILTTILLSNDLKKTIDVINQNSQSKISLQDYTDNIKIDANISTVDELKGYMLSNHNKYIKYSQSTFFNKKMKTIYLENLNWEQSGITKSYFKNEKITKSTIINNIKNKMGFEIDLENVEVAFLNNFEKDNLSYFEVIELIEKYNKVFKNINTLDKKIYFTESISKIIYFNNKDYHSDHTILGDIDVDTWKKNSLIIKKIKRMVEQLSYTKYLNKNEILLQGTFKEKEYFSTELKKLIDKIVVPKKNNLPIYSLEKVEFITLETNLKLNKLSLKIKVSDLLELSKKIRKYSFSRYQEFIHKILEDNDSILLTKHLRSVLMSKESKKIDLIINELRREGL